MGGEGAARARAPGAGARGLPPHSNKREPRTEPIRRPPGTTAHPAPTLVRYAVPGTSPCHQEEGWGQRTTPPPPPEPRNRHHAFVAQGIEHRSPKAGVAGSNPAGGTTRYSADLGFPPQGGTPFGLGLLVRGRLREWCVSGRIARRRYFMVRIRAASFASTAWRAALTAAVSRRYQILKMQCFVCPRSGVKDKSRPLQGVDLLP